MGVGYGHRQGIGGIIAVRFAPWQQHSDHGADLSLVRVADADHRLLDQVWSIFGNRDARLRRHQKRNGAGMAKFQGRGCALGNESLLDRRFFGLLFTEHRREAFVQLQEALGQ